MPDSDILLEKITIGSAVRVTAVCADTGVEVVFVAPTHATPLAIEHVAAAKLKAAKSGASTQQSIQARAARRGVVV